ncbi:hypothetical protein [Burkholderia stagnalis]|uniref:hypothetical protein n=1 Tax=Burkholderia stagnalis TaxID=1503054 RepID=UPI000F583619|nr:hypothetical protein [Burkholderia stagnalis]RQR11303.1 hypothetical protein DF025_17190 [Burkholderia stagnalis]RQR20331.1 hypothetical protein DF026_16995 [Burkholderia stagnalis]
MLQERQAEQRRAEPQRVNALIGASAWGELDLPTPEELTTILLSGEGESINGHFVVYDSDDGMTWCTNPYGIDGVLFNGRPTIDSVRKFLTDMARGMEYGPLPE